MLEELEVLALAYNSLSGSVSEVFLCWEKIKNIDPYSNFLIGAIPGFHDKLFYFSISNNMFTGTISDSFVYCQGLRWCK